MISIENQDHKYNDKINENIQKLIYEQKNKRLNTIDNEILIALK